MNDTTKQKLAAKLAVLRERKAAEQARRDHVTNMTRLDRLVRAAWLR